MQTSKQRVGFLLLILSVAMWIVLALHWNFTEKPFFYEVFKFEYIESSMPEAVPGMKWVSDESAWKLIDPKCVDRNERSSELTGKINTKWIAEKMTGARWPSECVKDTKRYETRHYVETHQSVGRFIDNLINSWGNYFWVNLIAFILFVTGLILFSGADVKLWRWIKFG